MNNQSFLFPKSKHNPIFMFMCYQNQTKSVMSSNKTNPSYHAKQNQKKPTNQTKLLHLFVWETSTTKKQKKNRNRNCAKKKKHILSKEKETGIKDLAVAEAAVAEAESRSEQYTKRTEQQTP